VTAGGVLSLLVAALLFSRYGIDGALARDEAVYAYGGQQLDAGVPFYVSIFDQKTPGAAYLAGIGVAIGEGLGVTDLDAIRAVFFVAACVTVVAVYLLAYDLWGSVVGALVAAVTFASFRGFAADALSGPDAKTPGIMFAVLTMVLLIRRRWIWAGVCGAVAFLVWQPLLIYLGAALVLASRRRLVVAGAALPIVATGLYFLLTGALGDFVQAAFAFPVTGLHRTPETLGQRLGHIAATVHDHYQGDVVQFWAGLALLPLLAAAAMWRRRFRDPLVTLVLPTFAAIAVFSAIDFQGYPDVYPLLPYAALGIGGTVALVLRRLRLPALRPVAIAATAVIAAIAWTQFSSDPAAGDVLAGQQAEAGQIQRLAGRHGTIYALGDPTPLVLTDRPSPSRFVFLASGVAAWEIARTPGGFPGWMREIQASHPAVIVVHSWRGPIEQRAAAWLHARYRSGFVGCWHVFVRPDVAKRAAQRGVVFGHHGCYPAVTRLA
jgi:hypothetical protein